VILHQVFQEYQNYLKQDDQKTQHILQESTDPASDYGLMRSGMPDQSLYDNIYAEVYNFKQWS